LTTTNSSGHDEKYWVIAHLQFALKPLQLAPVEMTGVRQINEKCIIKVDDEIQQGDFWF